MFERLDDQAKFAVERAFEEARAFRHDQVGTEHLLLGLVSDDDDHAAQALIRSGATLEGCRAKVVEAAAGKRRPSQGELTLTDRAARALERATRLSLRQLCPAVGTDHILLSVLDVEGTAGQVLRGLFVDLARLRAAISAPALAATPKLRPSPEARMPVATASRVTAAGPTASAAPASGAVPRCANCEAELDAALAHKAVASRGDNGLMVRWLIAYCSSCGAALGGYRLAE